MFSPSTLGFGPFFEEQCRHWKAGETIVARVAAEHRGVYESGHGKASARPSSRVACAWNWRKGASRPHWRLGGAQEEPAPTAPGSSTMSCRDEPFYPRGVLGLERAHRLLRPTSTSSLSSAAWTRTSTFARIERYLARIWGSGAQPAVILNKADLCEDAGILGRGREPLPWRTRFPDERLRAEGLTTIRATIREDDGRLRRLLRSRQIDTCERISWRRAYVHRRGPKTGWPRVPYPGTAGLSFCRRSPARHPGHARATACQRRGPRLGVRRYRFPFRSMPLRRFAGMTRNQVAR